MNFFIAEAYYGGSHALIANLFKEQLTSLGYDVHIFKLSPRHWRWRLQSGHISLSDKMNAFTLETGKVPDFILTTSMTNTLALKGLLKPSLRKAKLITFFHENQLAYPLNPQDISQKAKADFLKFYFSEFHLSQCLGSDHIFFNSNYNYQTTLEGIHDFLKKAPDEKPKNHLEFIKEKAKVIHLGVPIEWLAQPSWKERPYRILWSHRLEYDKNPSEFCQLARDLNSSLSNISSLELSLLGEQRAQEDPFQSLKLEFGSQVIHTQRLESRDHYLNELKNCRLLPVTSHQEFFGISVMEAIFQGVIPLLPNRLSYPELIPIELHQDLLYKNYEDLKSKAHTLITDGLTPRKTTLLRDHCQKFQTNPFIERFLKELGLP